MTPNKGPRFVTFLASDEETVKLNKAWKKSECMNRTQWMKKAINAYAGERIFTIRGEE